MIILGYWITNIVGFMLMHHGVSDLLLKETKKYTKKELAKDILISVVYTVIVVLLVLSGFIQFPFEYFNK